VQVVSGIDLIEVSRVEQTLARHGERFLQRVYTAAEQEQAGGRASSLAARFAAKEAAAKALGCGIGEVGWLDVEIVLGEKRQPYLYLHGAAKRLAQTQGWQSWSVSLSHTLEHAVAVVVAVRAPDPSLFPEGKGS
jgi:holo-[acyl-carrier protein] synthase